MKYVLVCVIGAVLVIWLLNAFCFCFEAFRFVPSDAIINKAIAYDLSDESGPASEAAVADFTSSNPDCCGITNWYGGGNITMNFVLGSLFFSRRVEVAVVTPIAGSESDDVYLRYWKVDPCGRAYPGFGTEMSRQEAARLVGK